MPNGAPAPAVVPNAQAAAAAQPGQPPNAGANPPQPDPSTDMQLGNMGDPDFGMDFIDGLDNENLGLDTFDFSSYLNVDGGFDFDVNLAFDGAPVGNGIEGAN